MTTQHTPGPWTLGTGHGTGRDHAVCAGPSIIAKVVGSGYPVGEGWSPKSAADARLISAAPELLAALEDCVAYIHSTGDISASWILEHAKAVLAKAGSDRP